METLLADTPHVCGPNERFVAARDGVEHAWLPAFLWAVASLDKIWFEAGITTVGQEICEATTLDHLQSLTEQAAQNVLALRAALLRRLLTHMRAALSDVITYNNADRLDEVRSRAALRIIAAVLPDGESATPHLSPLSAKAASDVFNVSVACASLLGFVPSELAAPLAAALRAAATKRKVRRPLEIEGLVSLLLAELEAGRHFERRIALHLLDMVACVLERGDECGADELETIAEAMRAAAWLATGAESEDAAHTALDAIAVANARHKGALTEIAVAAWSEANHACDTSCLHGGPSSGLGRRLAQKSRLRDTCFMVSSADVWGPAHVDLQRALGSC